MKEERGLGTDPTEARQENCANFVGGIAHSIGEIACCVQITSCCVGCCSPDGEGARECSAEGRRASRACWSIAHTLYKGIWAIKIIAIGCMSGQMTYEDQHGKQIPTKNAPDSMKMERGNDVQYIEPDEDKNDNIHTVDAMTG